MRILDTVLLRRDTTDDAEQLAPDDPAPRGEDRDGFLVSLISGGSSSRRSTPTVATDTALPPARMADDHESYYHHPLVKASYTLFADTVLEPGVRVTASKGGETDEEMQSALRLWSNNAAIHAGQTGQDLSVLLHDLITHRPSKGTQFMELVGTESDPSSLAALMLHKPETFKQFRRENQNLLVQPDDNVDRNHPRTPSGDAAAYAQYDDELTGYADYDTIPFDQGDLVKFVYDAEPGDLWGTPIYETIGRYITSLRQKFRDRDIAIRQTGYPHRIYSSEGWTKQEAETYADAHKEGDVSAGPDLDNDYKESFAGRVDFVPSQVDVSTESGEVPDISDAVRDDIEMIFSVLPVAKLKVAYEEDLNQFVAEPQMAKDSLLIDKERRYLEGKFQPIFERKADELAGGSYSGTVRFHIEASPETNPLQREAFPAENLDTLSSAVNNLYSAGAPPELVMATLSYAGYDMEEVREEFGFSPDDLASIVADESTPEGQAQVQAIAEAVEADD